MTTLFGHLAWDASQIKTWVLLKAFRGLYATQLSPLPRISGRAIVVGSAPGARLPQSVKTDCFTITINASQTQLPALGLSGPDLTIFRPQFCSPGEAQKIYWEVLKGGGTRFLLALVRSRADEGVADHLRKIGYSPDRVSEFPYWARNAVVADMSQRYLMGLAGGNRDVSNGLFAIALALKLGAEEVVTTGFSLENGWSYAPGATAKRGHKSADIEIAMALANRGLPVFGTDERFCKATGLRMLA